MEEEVGGGACRLVHLGKGVTGTELEEDGVVEIGKNVFPQFLNGSNR